MKEPVVGVERRQSVVASPTTCIERNRIFELGLATQ
jgi:hypothetical protein